MPTSLAALGMGATRRVLWWEQVLTSMWYLGLGGLLAFSRQMGGPYVFIDVCPAFCRIWTTSEKAINVLSVIFRGGFTKGDVLGIKTLLLI